MYLICFCNFCFYIVGNKNESDLVKKVCNDHAQQLANKYSCDFIETSAKNNENVDLVC